MTKKTSGMPVPPPASGAELAAREAFNFALFQYNPAPATVVDRQGRVVKSNLARRRTGQPLPPLGRPLFENVRIGDLDLQAELRRCIATSTVKYFPEQHIDDRFLSITMAPFPEGAIVICEDITERKRAEEEARRQQDQLIQAQKLATLGTLVSGVAHEISNPNNIMILSASVLQTMLNQLLERCERCAAFGAETQIGPHRYPEFVRELREQLEVLTRAAHRIRQFVDELKDFARQDEVLSMEPVDLNEVVRNAVRLLGPTIKQATERWRLVLAPVLPPVLGNSRRLEQVVVNLLTNACQALQRRDQGITLTTRYEAVEGWVCMSVQDEGVGIPPENLARIKDPFFTTKQDTGGTGLGLSVSDKIVTLHRGQLTFASEPGRGTTATLRLPAQPPAQAASGHAGRTARQTRRQPPGAPQHEAPGTPP